MRTAKVGIPPQKLPPLTNEDRWFTAIAVGAVVLALLGAAASAYLIAILKHCYTNG